MAKTRWLIAASFSLAACAQLPPTVAPPSLVVDEPSPYRLLAAGELAIRAVTADSSAPNLGPERLWDMNLTTAWMNGGYNNATSTVTIELTAEGPISHVAIKTPPSKPGTGYDVLVSRDGTSWTTALANQTNSTWNMESKALPAGTSGRFVRIAWRNNPASPDAHFSVYEVAVISSGGASPATPAPTPVPSTSAAPTTPPSPPPAGSLAASASSSLSGFTPDRVLDGDMNTQWANGGYREAEAHLTLDLGTVKPISTFSSKMRPPSGSAGYRLEVSNDGAAFTPVTGLVRNTSWSLETRTLPAGTSGRFLRLRFTNDPAAPMDRFGVFEVQLTTGTTSPTAPPSLAPTPVPSVAPPSSGGFAPRTLTRLSPIGRAVASSGSPGLAVDGNPLSAWAPSAGLPAYVSVPLAQTSAGPLLVMWHSSGYHYLNTGYAPRHYALWGSDDSTDGVNGSWYTLKTVTDNPMRSRIDTVNAPSARWIRLQTTSRWNVGPQLRELAVYGAAASGRLDAWLLIGDSITAQAFDPAGPNHFSPTVAARTGSTPLVVGGGTGSDTAALAQQKLAAGLPHTPSGSYVGLALGTNDATLGVPVATFKAQMQAMITSIKNSGRTPMLARVPWNLNGQLPRYVQAIDELRAENGLPAGPDLYTHFKNNPQQLQSDRVHPTETGEVSIQRLWAEAVARAYGR